MQASLPVVEAWVDGACVPNPGHGGWGAVLSCNGHEKEFWGPQEHSESFEHQTNNRMELIAAIEALKALKEPCEIRIYSDSAYLIYTMQRRYSKGTNLDLWQILEEVSAPHVVEWIKIKGHQGKNIRPHFLAERAASKGKQL